MDIIVYLGVVLSVTQIFKKAFGITSKFVPLVALLVGSVFYAIAVLTGVATLDYQSIINAVAGILSAMGLYSSTKTITSK